VSAGGDGGEKKKVGRGLLDRDSVLVLSTEFQYLALIKKLSVCSSNVLSCSWYSVFLPNVFGVEIGMVKIRGLMRVASGFRIVMSHCCVVHLKVYSLLSVYTN
jgi:hypothetical protein